MSRQIEWGEVSEDGALQLPENILSEMGFSTGAKFKIILRRSKLNPQPCSQPITENLY